MKIPIYQVDAFAQAVFKGNPAAVCPIQRGEWPSDETLQHIAKENNLSETAFFCPRSSNAFDLRWFTPAIEVDLCGHATLATAHILYSELHYDQDSIIFHTRSGELIVSKVGEQYLMDFPAQEPQPIEISKTLIEGLKATPLQAVQAADIIAEFGSESEVKALQPDFRILKGIDTRGIIATAPGDKVDFVSRFFGPAAGIDEDPVTGSAHCELTPFWAKKLNKHEFHALQVSERGGELFCSLEGDRVKIKGNAQTYLRGEIWV